METNPQSALEGAFKKAEEKKRTDIKDKLSEIQKRMKNKILTSKQKQDCINEINEATRELDSPKTSLLISSNSTNGEITPLIQALNNIMAIYVIPLAESIKKAYDPKSLDGSEINNLFPELSEILEIIRMDDLIESEASTDLIKEDTNSETYAEAVDIEDLEEQEEYIRENNKSHRIHLIRGLKNTLLTYEKNLRIILEGLVHNENIPKKNISLSQSSKTLESLLMMLGRTMLALRESITQENGISREIQAKHINEILQYIEKEDNYQKYLDGEINAQSYLSTLKLEENKEIENIMHFQEKAEKYLSNLQNYMNQQAEIIGQIKQIDQYFLAFKQDFENSIKECMKKRREDFLYENRHLSYKEFRQEIEKTDFEYKDRKVLIETKQKQGF